MNVAIFTDNDFEKVTGVTTTLHAVVQHAPAGVHPRIYTTSDRGVDQRSYVAIRSIGMNIPFYRGMKMYVPRIRALVRHALEDRIDVVHLTTPGPMGLAALYVGSRLGLPLLGSFHTDLAAYARVLSGSPRLGELLDEYMRWPYGKCDRVLVPSESTKRLLLAGGRRWHIDVWRRGVDADMFTPARRSHALRRAWGVSCFRPAVLYVGRVSREKGLDILPAIQQQLQAAGVAHRLVIVGDGPLRAELSAQCSDAVFTGMLPREQAAEAFASADVFIFPSETDTAGNVVLEAQAAGLPVLVSDSGGPREYMIEGRTGFVCAGGNSHAFARPLAALLTDPAQRLALGTAAREYAVTVGWERALEPLYAAYLALGRDRSRSFREYRSRRPSMPPSTLGAPGALGVSELRSAIDRSMDSL